MLVRVDHGEHHALHQASLRASGYVEKIERHRRFIRRHLSFEAGSISAVTKMGREQSIAVSEAALTSGTG